MDRIIINALRIYAFHGVNSDEKEKGQPFELDLVCYVDLTKPCASDDVNDTVSYAQIIKTVRQNFTKQSFDLLEKAAQSTVDCIFKAFPAVAGVDIVLKKPRAPILADFGYVAVEISRKRADNG